MGFPRQEYWSGLRFPPPGDLPHPGLEPGPPVSPALQMDALTAALCWKPSTVGLSKDEKSESVSHSVVSYSLWPYGPQPARLLCPWDAPGQNTGVGCRSRLQGVFPTQGLNPGLLHRRQTLYHLSHQGSPDTLQGNPLQYSCLVNPTDRGAWRATVHGLQRVRHN